MWKKTLGDHRTYIDPFSVASKGKAQDRRGRLVNVDMTWSDGIQYVKRRNWGIIIGGKATSITPTLKDTNSKKHWNQTVEK